MDIIDDSDVIAIVGIDQEFQGSRDKPTTEEGTPKIVIEQKKVFGLQSTQLNSIIIPISVLSCFLYNCFHSALSISSLLKPHSSCLPNCFHPYKFLDLDITIFLVFHLNVL